MSRIYHFIKDCGTFFVCTLNDGSPACRPFGAIMEYHDCLYISTSDTKPVYTQLCENRKIQIVALKNGTREWGRVNGFAEECADPALKQRMLEECPVLTKHFPSADALHYKLFAIEIINSEFYQ